MRLCHRTGEGGDGSGSDDSAGAAMASPLRGAPQDIIVQAPPRRQGEAVAAPDSRPQVPLRSAIQRWQVGLSVYI